MLASSVMGLYYIICLGKNDHEIFRSSMEMIRINPSHKGMAFLDCVLNCFRLACLSTVRFECVWLVSCLFIILFIIIIII